MTQSRNERKVAQRMQPYMLERYAALFHVKFEKIDGRVYAVNPGETKPRNIQDTYNKAQAETEHNKQWFHYGIGDTQLERWQNNLALAISVRTFWDLKLRTAFPYRQFVLLIWNEIMQVVDENDSPFYTEIAPSLRLWTKSNDPKLERYKYYQVSKERLDVVKLRVERSFIFVQWPEVFTKAGTIQKKFERRITDPDLVQLAY